MTTSDLATFERALAFQSRLVRRGKLSPAGVHSILEDSYETVVGTVCLHCTCGQWIQAPVDGSEQRYTIGHVARELRLAVAA